MNENKEIRINQILGSLEGMQRVEPPAGFWSHVQERLVPGFQGARQLSPRTVWLAAAAIGLLLILNVTAATRYLKKEESTHAVNIIQEYQLVGNEFDLYK